jgi:hypothetical protein
LLEGAIDGYRRGDAVRFTIDDQHHRAGEQRIVIV